MEAATSAFPDARWQRCVVHFERNILSAVPREKMAEVAAMLKAVYASEDRPAAEAKAEQVATKLTAMRLTSAAHATRGRHGVGERAHLDMKLLRDQDAKAKTAGEGVGRATETTNDVAETAGV